MKSNAPLRKLHRIVRMPDESARVHALDEWIENRTATVAVASELSNEANDIAQLKQRFMEKNTESALKCLREVISQDETDVIGDDAKTTGRRCVWTSLTVIVPEGVEHPRKRQAREQVEANKIAR